MRRPKEEPIRIFEHELELSRNRDLRDYGDHSRSDESFSRH